MHLMNQSVSPVQRANEANLATPHSALSLFKVPPDLNLGDPMNYFMGLPWQGLTTFLQEDKLFTF